MYAFSMKTISVFDRYSVDDGRKRIEMYTFSNENALVWTGPGHVLSSARGLKATCVGTCSRAQVFFLIFINKLLLYEVLLSFSLF